MRKYTYLAFLIVFLAVFIRTSTSISAAPRPITAEIIVQTIPGPSVAEKVVTRTKTSWPWYVSRGSGIAAAVFLTILIVSGVGLITGYTFRFLEPLTAWSSHRALGLGFGVSVLIHIFSLLFDKFTNFTIWQLFIPWLSKYKPVTLFGLHLGSLYLALGIIAFYGVLLVILSSLFWIDKKPYTWKLLHLLSYLIIVIVFLHAFYIGTDLAHGIFRVIWVGSGIVITTIILYRLWRAKTI